MLLQQPKRLQNQAFARNTKEQTTTHKKKSSLTSCFKAGFQGDFHGK